MRLPMFLVTVIISVTHARLSTFVTDYTILDLQQGVEVFAQADIDRDGDIDWAVQTRTDGNIAVVSNECYGKFSSIEIVTSVRDIYSLDLGDVDDDSIADILVAGQEGTSAAWRLCR